MGPKGTSRLGGGPGALRRYWSGDVLLAEDRFEKQAPTGYTTATHFLKVSAEWNTRIYVYNYWSWNYKLEGVALNVRFTDREGRIVCARTVAIPPHGHHAIDARELLANEGIRELEGEAFFQMTGNGLNPENPIQLIADYEYPHGLTSVHGQGGLSDYTFSQRMHQLAVRESSEWSTSFDVKNHYIGDEPLQGQILVELFNGAGQRQQVEIPVPPSQAGKRYDVRELFPAAVALLGETGGLGHLRVTAPYKMHRLFYMHTNGKTGTQSVNHGTVEHNHHYDEWTGIPSDVYRQMGCRPVTVAPVLLSNEFDSRVILINAMGPPEGDQIVQIDVYNEQGGPAPVVSTRVELPKHHSRVIEFASLVGRKLFQGHATISVPWREGLAAYPRQVDCIPEVSWRGYPGATHVGSGAFNIATGNEYFRQSGTRIFARIIADGQTETTTVMIYPTCGHESPAESATEMALIRDDGAMLQGILRIPRNGTRVFRLQELFPEASSFLRRGSCTLRLADKQVRLLGFHLTRCAGKPGIAMDHFFGG